MSKSYVTTCGVLIYPGVIPSTRLRLAEVGDTETRTSAPEYTLEFLELPIVPVSLDLKESVVTLRNVAQMGPQFTTHVLATDAHGDVNFMPVSDIPLEVREECLWYFTTASATLGIDIPTEPLEQEGKTFKPYIDLLPNGTVYIPKGEAILISHQEEDEDNDTASNR
ncbi:hypothetical protein [Brochothrix phage BtpYZU04]